MAWVMHESVSSYAGPVMLVTVTAPGRSVLPWSIERPSECDRAALAEWSVTIPERWRSLNNKARTNALNRSKASSGLTVIAYVWQSQKRGAPHLHVLVPATLLGRRYASAVKELAASHGFGFVDIQPSTGSALAAAHYLSRYLTRDLNERTNRFAGFLPRRPAYVNRHAMRKAGVSVRIARCIRRLWVYANIDRNPNLISTSDFRDERISALTYYWFRCNLRGRENVPRSYAFDL